MAKTLSKIASLVPPVKVLSKASALILILDVVDLDPAAGAGVGHPAEAVFPAGVVEVDRPGRTAAAGVGAGGPLILRAEAVEHAADVPHQRRFARLVRPVEDVHARRREPEVEVAPDAEARSICSSRILIRLSSSLTVEAEFSGPAVPSGAGRLRETPDRLTSTNSRASRSLRIRRAPGPSGTRHGSGSTPTEPEPIQTPCRVPSTPPPPAAAGPRAPVYSRNRFVVSSSPSSTEARASGGGVAAPSVRTSSSRNSHSSRWVFDSPSRSKRLARSADDPLDEPHRLLADLAVDQLARPSSGPVRRS